MLDTVEDHELLDPNLAPDRLLYRLYHEDGVTVFPVRPLARHCTCSRNRHPRHAAAFPDGDRADMVKDGTITVTCEFCSSQYRLKPDLAAK